MQIFMARTFTPPAPSRENLQTTMGPLRRLRVPSVLQRDHPLDCLTNCRKEPVAIAA